MMMVLIIFAVNISVYKILNTSIIGVFFSFVLFVCVSSGDTGGGLILPDNVDGSIFWHNNHAWYKIFGVGK